MQVWFKFLLSSYKKPNNQKHQLLCQSVKVPHLQCYNNTECPGCPMRAPLAVSPTTTYATLSAFVFLRRPLLTAPIMCPPFYGSTSRRTDKLIWSRLSSHWFFKTQSTWLPSEARNTQPAAAATEISNCIQTALWCDWCDRASRFSLLR